jgi:lysophospholipase L1-like esterase
MGRSRIALALTLALAQCAKPAPAPPMSKTAEMTLPTLSDAARVDDRRLFSASGLERFFAALDRLERQRAARPLRILQIGDSHTAGDAFSSRMRDLLQTRFGAAGRGWLPAGIPFRYYRPRLVTVTAEGWRQLGPRDAGPDVPLGLDAAVAESEYPGALMMLASGEAPGFDRLGLEFVARPAGPPLQIRIDRQESFLVSTAAARIRAKRVAIPVGSGAHTVALTALDRRSIALLGWEVERDRPGIIYENHGTIGATVDLLGRLSPRTVAAELADSRPALIVVAFGTNEGFDDSLDLGGYAARFRARVAALRAMAPRAALLVLGPPDGNRLAPSCPHAAARQDVCVAGGEVAAPACSWHEPPNLAAVRHIQQRVAAAEGWALWDWSQAMGGPCSMHRLFLRDPPLAFADHVHLNGAGYRATADVLFFDLMNAYEGWKRGAAPVSE